MIPETWLPTSTVWVGFNWPVAVTVTVRSPIRASSVRNCCVVFAAALL